MDANTGNTLTICGWIITGALGILNARGWAFFNDTRREKIVSNALLKSLMGLRKNITKNLNENDDRDTQISFKSETQKAEVSNFGGFFDKMVLPSMSILDYEVQKDLLILYDHYIINIETLQGKGWLTAGTIHNLEKRINKLLPSLCASSKRCYLLLLFTRAARPLGLKNLIPKVKKLLPPCM